MDTLSGWHIDNPSVSDILRENKRRWSVMTDGFDPVLGTGLPLKRRWLNIPDFVFPRQYVPVQLMSNPLIKMVRKAKTLENFVLSTGTTDTDEAKAMLTRQIILARASVDPGFAFFIFFKIQDKVTGRMIPFRLNYPQRLMLSVLEDMREHEQPIRLIILKARQWGGSTLAQLYMAWIQIFIKEGWYSVILAQTENTSKRIKAMYTKTLGSIPPWVVDCKGDSLQFKPYERSTADSILTLDNGDVARNNVVSIASYENYDAVRGGSYAMAHYSETAYWTNTDGKDPEGVMASVSGGILELPLTVEIIESSARAMAGFFYDECQRAMRGESSRRFLFIPFFFIENDSLPLPDEHAFAEWLISVKDMSEPPEGCQDEGRYYYRMWCLGATLQHIYWYLRKRKSLHSHAAMASEAPVDEIEAFKSAGNLVFSMYDIEEMERLYKREPVFRGDINHTELTGADALSPRLHEDANGPLRIWARPNSMNVTDRYVVSVDIGGRSRDADYSVITVIDRLGLMTGLQGKPKVVARWRGHIRHDQLAWKAVSIAAYYNNALLIFESNTLEREKDNPTDGGNIEYVLDQVADVYDNLYYRHSKSEQITEGTARVWGFQTNRSTKPKLIDNLVAYVEDMLWDEPDADMYDELKIYEKRDDGTFGNVRGNNKHDDVLMSTAIGLYVSQYEMELPTMPKPAKKPNYTDDITAATI